MLSRNQRRAWEALDIGPAWMSRTPIAEDVPSAQGAVPESDAPRCDPTARGDQTAGGEPTARASTAGSDTRGRWTLITKAVEDCRDCSLAASRQRTVPGAGSTNARWLLVGEAPGAEEDKQGQPFVGRAGELLDAILFASGIDRESDVFITNVLKCRPPGNRNPEPDEVAKCERHLLAQLELLEPTLIVVLGRFAAQSLLRTEASIASLRGRVHEITSAGRAISAVVTYHPAYLLRNPADKARAWADWCLARQEMERIGVR